VFLVVKGHIIIKAIQIIKMIVWNAPKVLITIEKDRINALLVVKGDLIIKTIQLMKILVNCALQGPIMMTRKRPNATFVLKGQVTPIKMVPLHVLLVLKEVNAPPRGSQNVLLVCSLILPLLLVKNALLGPSAPRMDQQIALRVLQIHIKIKREKQSVFLASQIRILKVKALLRVLRRRNRNRATLFLGGLFSS
jgi:hypothetical protein